MARNGRRGGGRVGAVRQRCQFKNDGVWFKRDAATGRILNGKAAGTPHKGVTKED